MADKPINPIIHLTDEEAGRLLSLWLDRIVDVKAVRRLTGGCVNTVVRVDYDDGDVAVKLSHNLNDPRLQQECDVLNHFERVPAFRTPRLLYRDFSGETLPYSFFIMEFLRGVNLADATASQILDDPITIEKEIAEAVARLHTQKRDTFGSCAEEETYAKWSDCFQNALTKQ